MEGGCGGGAGRGGVGRGGTTGRGGKTGRGGGAGCGLTMKTQEWIRERIQDMPDPGCV